jgi:hypothetical protein
VGIQKLIKQTLEMDDFFRVCDKIKETNDCRIKESILLEIMALGRINDNIMTFVNYEHNKMNGCIVLALQKDITGDMTLSVIYMFVDRHYPDLTREFIKLVEEKAVELKADKIMFTTHRDPKAIIRKYGDAGYQHRCSVIEKRF